ncbi:Mucin-associated surface protein (MASP) [Trypanosoma cruzi]|uniref:Mucin-associated surface protein (MASP), putative n=2 Tax=Trypanosoma cruzi TaxID=5693 RepID=Q4DPT8_TRYCC|nr:mucin-associated surface protein (MASP), putative [Trypanosoma cruzi]EAN94536.1 mucin-associated surface protein (MASP), putative [Trypanosoma cruzi]PWV20007.1 Mucin-associated surface protein (MASP) [Trypanosoma cruzi]|eukprot:XP_816387.1 mucin-associated surface protein (MASP) [Trypanosoma cruzi strain CL Brener]
MAMMMTGRVLLVCALCVLWCGLSVVANGGTDDLVSGRDEKNAEHLSSSDLSLPVRQGEPTAAGGGRGSTNSQEGKEASMSNTGIRLPQEQEVKLDAAPHKPTGNEYENKGPTEAGADTRNQPAPPPPPISLSEEEDDELTKATQDQDSPVEQESTQNNEILQEEPGHELNTQNPLPQEQHTSEQPQVKQEHGKEKQRSGQLEQREHREEPKDQQQKQEKQDEESIKHEEKQQQQKDEIQDQQHQQHEHPTENEEESAKDENVVRTNVTAAKGDSDDSIAVSHTTSPLLPLLVACAAVAAVVAA